VNITVIWRFSVRRECNDTKFLRKVNNDISTLRVQAQTTKFSRLTDQIQGTCAPLSTNMTVFWCTTPFQHDIVPQNANTRE